MIPLQEGVDVEPVRRIPSVMLALLRIGLAAMASLAATWAGAAVPAAARTCEAADWTVGGAGVEHPRADCAAGPVLNAGSYREVWRRDYDGLLEFPPSYAGGVLYTAMDNGWVTAQRTTGSVVWSRRFTTPWPHGPRDAHYNAIVHTPTYWNGRLYFQTKNMGRIWCLDAATGKTIWKFVNMGGEAAPIVIPTRRGPRVYAVEREGRVVVLDALTGEPIWAKQMLGHTTSALAYSDRRLFGADYDGNVIAFKRNGNVVWRRHLAFSSSYANMAVRYGRLYAVSRLGWAFSLGTGAGRVRWKTHTAGIDLRPPGRGRRPRLHREHRRHVLEAVRVERQGGVGDPPHPRDRRPGGARAQRLLLGDGPARPPGPGDRLQRGDDAPGLLVAGRQVLAGGRGRPHAGGGRPAQAVCPAAGARGRAGLDHPGAMEAQALVAGHAAVDGSSRWPTWSPISWRSALLHQPAGTAADDRQPLRASSQAQRENLSTSSPVSQRRSRPQRRRM